ncbi:MAG: tRNA (adenosine(37)-N6)-threonylcarbamoyltransferase complex ATPase subunit type 1 TsaE [Coriobacteriia bacterium]|nr:tRNA (adenosine(37)-N6)-threonylcarbamoyltransferase complex ATPase subunit type 1 TsaE [Coriobacteriia bacterium]
MDLTDFSLVARTESADQTKQVAAALADQLQPDDAILFTGDLGAGKTQFVQGVAAQLGVADAVTSPTFNILISYQGGRLPLHHFDLYRLEDPDELDDIAFFETVEGGGASFVEWSEKFPDHMPEDALHVDMGVVLERPDSRVIRAFAEGTRAEQLLAAWTAAL